MKKIFAAMLLGFILFSFPVFSSELYQYNVKAEIFKNNSVHYEINLIFVNHEKQNFSMFLLSPENIQIANQTSCDIQKRVLGTDINCLIPASQRTLVSIEYDSTETLIKKDGYVLFSDSFRMFMDTNTLSVIIKLPEGAGLKEPIENSYTPSGALKGSDGRRLILSWLENDFKQGERFDVSIASEKFIEIIPSSLPVEGFLVIIFVLFIGFFALYRFYLSKRFLKLVLPILKEDEKIIFDCLMKHGNGVNQKVIVRESKYSKAKVSKVLKSLKERGIIKLERIGRTNKIYIEKKFQKKT